MLNTKRGWIITCMLFLSISLAACQPEVVTETVEVPVEVTRVVTETVVTTEEVTRVVTEIVVTTESEESAFGSADFISPYLREEFDYLFGNSVTGSPVVQTHDCRVNPELCSDQWGPQSSWTAFSVDIQPNGLIVSENHLLRLPDEPREPEIDDTEANLWSFNDVDDAEDELKNGFCKDSPYRVRVDLYRDYDHIIFFEDTVEPFGEYQPGEERQRSITDDADLTASSVLLYCGIEISVTGVSKGVRGGLLIITRH